MTETKLENGWYTIKNEEDLVGFLGSTPGGLHPANFYSKTDVDHFCWEVESRGDRTYQLIYQGPSKCVAYGSGPGGADPRDGGELMGVMSNFVPADGQATWELVPVDGKENTFFVMTPDRSSWRGNDAKRDEGFMWTVSEPGKQSKIKIRLGKTDSAKGTTFNFEKFEFDK